MTLKNRHESIWREVLHLHDIYTPLTPKAAVMELDPRRCANSTRLKDTIQNTTTSLKRI